MDTKRIGLHIRLKEGLAQVAQEALNFNLSHFQFFLTPSPKSAYINIGPERENFLMLKQNHFQSLFLHSSYWINPATGKAAGFAASKGLLRKEQAIAQKLEIPFLVVHGGVAKDHPTTPEDPQAKKAGIQTLAKTLNHLVKQESTVQILLENCAHGNRTIGNDFNDFLALKQELDQPEKIGFCVDLAHAFSYGYQLADTENFVQILSTTIGLDAIKLIHFNDSAELCGSKKDHHALPGHGLIGKDTLKSVVNHPTLAHIPLIIEPPHAHSSKNTLKSLLEEFNTW